MATDTNVFVRLVNEINDEVPFVPPGPERTRKLKEIVQRRLDDSTHNGERTFYKHMLQSLSEPEGPQKTHD